MSRLEGLTVALTGAAGGIGTLVAGELVRAGANVVGIDRVACAACCETITADLGDAQSLDALAAALAARRIDLLVNLAGIQYFGVFDRQGGAGIRLSYAINLAAPAVLAAAVLPQMVARGDGQIVNIGSMMGAVPYPYFTTYSSAKAGLKALSQALRRELAGSGVSVTHISPRAVRTPLNTPAIRSFMAATGMHADDPESVAARIMSAIEARARDVSIGLPERLFAQVNALLPGVIDRGLSSQVEQARSLLYGL